MCGRYALGLTPREIEARFGITEIDQRRPPVFPIPLFNVGPGRPVPVVVEDAEARRLRPMVWGFRPAWLRTAPKRPPPINARAETVLERPMFRGAVQRHRCVVPATGFYEWAAGQGRQKQPWHFKLRNEAPFAFAGLWASGGEDGEPSVLLLTTAPNHLVATVHDRMPVILQADDEALWLDPEVTDPRDVLGCIGPYPPERMTGYPVSTAVNAVGNDGPELVEPLASA